MFPVQTGGVSVRPLGAASALGKQVFLLLLLFYSSAASLPPLHIPRVENITRQTLQMCLKKYLVPARGRKAYFLTTRRYLRTHTQHQLDYMGTAARSKGFQRKVREPTNGPVRQPTRPHCPSLTCACASLTCARRLKGINPKCACLTIDR